MQSLDQPPHRPLRLGMVGGGPGSNIGATHRQAARLDGRYDLVAGVFASDAARSRAFAATLGIAPERRYATWHEMAAQETGRSDGIEVVAIMTPNNSHYAIAKAFLEQGVDNGARRLMWVSMVATGHWHGQRIRVYGEKGSLEWVQETPNELIFRPTDGPHQILARGSSFLPRKRAVSHASGPATRMALSTPSPTFTATSQRRSWHGATASPQTRWRSPSRPSKTVCWASSLSRRRWNPTRRMGAG